MPVYINRLIKCGYSYDKARNLCLEYTRNLSLLDLEYLIETLEKHYVG